MRCPRLLLAVLTVTVTLAACGQTDDDDRKPPDGAAPDAAFDAGKTVRSECSYQGMVNNPDYPGYRYFYDCNESISDPDCTAPNFWGPCSCYLVYCATAP